ncbi:MAG: aminopeptidase [Burkholderiaceae bacterium]
MLMALLLGACADTRYYWQSLSGHLYMLNASRPVGDWLSDHETSAELKDRLALSRRIRSFAVTELGLPDNPSYQRYADLKRRAVVWNVVAAPEFSLALREFCFPVLGCVTYRGYFDEAQARALADTLRAQGMEVSVYGVPAYSTLGWMNWAGGDPLLNTFIHYPEGELARLIFHELAHQVAYARDDTMFNESFATAVEQMGATRWLAGQATDDARTAYTAFDQRRRAFRALALETREQLQRIYKDATTEPSVVKVRRLDKQAALQAFRERYGVLRASWGGYAGYDQWVANANNASFGAQAAYDELVPAFEALYAQHPGNWPAFYDAVKRLAGMPSAERDKILKTTRSRTENNGG